MPSESTQPDHFSIAVNDAIRIAGDVPVPKHGWCSWGSHPHYRPAAWRHEACMVQAARSAGPETLAAFAAEAVFWIVTWPARAHRQPATGCVVLLDEPPSLETIALAASVFALGHAIEIRGDNIADVVAFCDRLARLNNPTGKGNIGPEEAGDRCLIFDATGSAVGCDTPSLSAYDIDVWAASDVVMGRDKDAPIPGAWIILAPNGTLSSEGRRVASRILSVSLPVGLIGPTEATVAAARVALLATQMPAAA